MPARIASLRDLDHGGGSANNNDERDENSATQNTTSHHGDGASAAGDVKIRHIPTLSDADKCLSILNRIYKEFYPIIQKRGYRISSISEMCCCGDGLDHEGRRRKLRIMGPNVGGYNMTRGGRGGKTHTIHLRLRNPQGHFAIKEYEEVAGVMAHEMAHCQHQNHSAAFYKLMDEILEQHAVFMAKGIVADKQGFPVNSNQAYTLGGGGSSSTTGNKGKNAALEAAQRRQAQQTWMPQGPQKLGGNTGFQGWLAPGQAAAQAAEERRLRDELWCQPCSDVIELSSDSEDENGDTEGGHDRKPAAKQDTDDGDDQKPAAVGVGADSDKENTAKQNDDDGGRKTAAAARPASVVTIDLTLSDDEEDTGTTTTTTVARGRRKRPHQDAASALDWSCSQCTYRNLPGTVVCCMCGKESPFAEETTKKVVAEIRKKDEIEHVKKAEVEQSVNEFGFNIYGTGKQATAKLPHIT